MKHNKPEIHATDPLIMFHANRKKDETVSICNPQYTWITRSILKMIALI